MKRQLWILAGGNGSGKSTFYDQFLKDAGIITVNADVIAKALSQPPSAEVSRAAQKIARETCSNHFQAGTSFCFETVFSHSSKLDLIQEARSYEYAVNLAYIHLSSSLLNQARVIQRVNEGGHDVPSDKIQSRIPRTMAHMKDAIPLVDEASLFDNSKGGAEAFRLIARVQAGKIISATDPLPAWAEEILSRIGR